MDGMPLKQMAFKLSNSVTECGSLSTDTCISQGQVNAGSIATVKGSRQQ